MDSVLFYPHFLVHVRIKVKLDMVLEEQDTNVQRRVRKEGLSQRGCLRSTRLGVVVHTP